MNVREIVGELRTNKDGHCFKAPCNITKNNNIEALLTFNSKFPYKVLCVRYKCGKIKWKCKGYRRRK